MCGISGGMSYPLNMGEINHIKTLMILGMLRGYEGSGAIVVRPHKDKLYVETVKSEFSSAELAVDSDFEDLLRQPKIIIAHSRAPTKGGEGKDFIHPHRVRHITGVHNGTMFEVMGKKIDDKESDSLAIFKALAEHSVEDFIKNSRGAYSLVWTDTKTGTLNFLRNDQRPMVWARIGSGDHASCMFWASEKSMLEYALLQRGSYTTSAVKFISPKPWEHVQFPLNVKNGLFPQEVKQYENPTDTPAYSKFHGGKWYTRSEWEKHLEDLVNKRDKQEVRSESVIPLLPPPPMRSTTTSTTSGPTNRGTGIERHSGTGHLRGNWPPADARLLPRAEEIVGRRRMGFQPFREVGPKLSEQLVSRGCCVVCDEKPRVFSSIKSGETEEVTLVPKIHPIKFGNAGLMQYICDDCVQSKNPIALSVLGASLPSGHA